MTDPRAVAAADSIVDEFALYPPKWSPDRRAKLAATIARHYAPLVDAAKLGLRYIDGDDVHREWPQARIDSATIRAALGEK